MCHNCLWTDELLLYFCLGVSTLAIVLTVIALWRTTRRNNRRYYTCTDQKLPGPATDEQALAPAGNMEYEEIELVKLQDNEMYQVLDNRMVCSSLEVQECPTTTTATTSGQGGALRYDRTIPKCTVKTSDYEDVQSPYYNVVWYRLLLWLHGIWHIESFILM